MPKTFFRDTINGRKYQFLTLPGSNLFKFEMVSTMGAHVERIVQQLTGRNVYGLSHLVEHLGFRCCMDYTTDELMQALKREGTYNASTDHERINYFFKTTSARMQTAINLVFNYGLNDLSKLTQEEFETERKTVYNEIKRYHDDDQTMFHFATMPTLCGYSTEDDILGTPEGVNASTLDDVRLIKAIFLTQGENVFNVTYDPEMLSSAEIVKTIEAEYTRFPVPEETDLMQQVKALYPNSYNEPRTNDTFQIDNESEQVMTALLFDTMSDVNLIAARVGNRYLSNLSPVSMTDYIREKNGLTYGLWLYDDQMAYKPYAVFGCDVTAGTEGKMMELMEQAVDDSVARFDEEAYNELMDMITLTRTLAFVDQEKYERLFWTALNHPHIIDTAADEFMMNVDVGYTALDERLCSYEDVSTYLKLFQSWVKDRAYGKVTNSGE